MLITSFNKRFEVSLFEHGYQSTSIRETIQYIAKRAKDLDGLLEEAEDKGETEKIWPGDKWFESFEVEFDCDSPTYQICFGVNCNGEILPDGSSIAEQFTEAYNDHYFPQLSGMGATA